MVISHTSSGTGFSNEALVTIGTLFLVIGAVERSHMVDWFARKAFGTTGAIWICKFRMYITCFLLSIFFNNTPLVAILLPVVKDWGRMRGIAASQLLIPLSYSVLAGSFGSMIGTSTNLTVQGLMQADRKFSVPFFAPLPIGIVCFLVLLVYQTVFAHYLLPHHKSGLLREARDNIKEYICEVFISSHSPSVGQSLSATMNSLGIAPSGCIKIRRRGARPEGVSRPEPATTSAQINFLDPAYLKEKAKFWLDNEKPPDHLIFSDTEKAPGDTEAGGSEYYDIIAPSFVEVVQAGDVLFISSARDAVEKFMKSIMGESRGLYILKGNVMNLPGFGSEVVEMVLSDSSPLIGLTTEEATPIFALKYQAGLITVRGKDWGNTLNPIRDQVHISRISEVIAIKVPLMKLVPTGGSESGH